MTRARLLCLVPSEGVGEVAFFAERVTTPVVSEPSVMAVGASGSGTSWFGGAKGFSNAIRSAANFEMPY